MPGPHRSELIATLRKTYRLLTEVVSNLLVPVWTRYRAWRTRNEVEDILIRDEGKDKDPDLGHRDPPEPPSPP